MDVKRMDLALIISFLFEILTDVIYPLLKQLEDDLPELMEDKYQKTQCLDIPSLQRAEEKKKPCRDLERDDECGICMETGSKVVLPNCGHSMCINCYNDW